ncbi:transcriptional regulator [Candidatus Scalindua japonica]|uniref:Transcriptional regulator n=2 Tax=Candidatus Scalindua japonica TaxID=1284222 RepID=A0A286TUJ0_9BACT|nr:transcriptional regulator [Candidatus Scalindua japonica]
MELDESSNYRNRTTEIEQLQNGEARRFMVRFFVVCVVWQETAGRAEGEIKTVLKFVQISACPLKMLGWEIRV